MCFCHLWNSVAVYQSRIRFKPEAIYHFLVVVTLCPLWLQSSEDMEKCSKGRVTQNLCFFLLKTSALRFSWFRLYSRWIYILSLDWSVFPVRFCLWRSALHKQKDTLLEFYVFPWVCVWVGSFCSLSSDAQFPHRLLNHRIQGLSAKNDSDAHPRTCKITVQRWVGESNGDSSPNRCSTLLHIRITRELFKMPGYPCSGPSPRESL